MQTRIRNFICIGVGVPTFLAIWLFSMFAGITLLIGFGFGILLHNYLNGFLKNWQKSIYLNEKADMAHRKLELQKELEKLNGEN